MHEWMHTRLDENTNTVTEGMLETQWQRKSDTIYIHIYNQDIEIDSARGRRYEHEKVTQARRERKKRRDDEQEIELGDGD